ncbi:Holliday junction branch migration protein RuvA [Thalassotalea litorea]|uniref:Holliday junction branch migration complex subunit RuvA n=1 Tax=Thalassotalea litorea TaxID=2020715 RepID=A0A5R9ILG6_9GAMM|nr:Holliday junction branch migration protein RuvA [Thalassotalea litorea]TLU64091.1 Holliday junction branch migration protein RuvA [Thalassotalea litorea]
MIGRLRGLLVDKQPPEIVIECGGVGYEVTLPMTSFYHLPKINEEAVIYTHFVVREDAQQLFGFANVTERKLFRLLIKVNGVGPKLALAILSNMSSSQFVLCVQIDDVGTIVKIPGVGKKTAERLLIEMRDRLKDWGQDLATPNADEFALQGEENGSTFVTVTNEKDDAITALVSLGYKQNQAEKAVSGVHQNGMSSEEIIRDALKSML